MQILWGIVIVVLSVLCWGGQVIVWLFPETGERLSLSEAKGDVDPAFWADVRGEAPWDSLTLWTLLAAGVLLIIDNSAWAYFGLVGGAMYVYFAGRGIFARVAMQRRGLRVGAPSNLKLGYAMLAIWGITGLITIVVAIIALPAS